MNMKTQENLANALPTANMDNLLSELMHYRYQSEKLKKINSLYQRMAGILDLPAMIEAYCRLHTMGFAHSVEIWHGGELSGGIYGVGLGRVFFGESMFGRRTNASKLAFVHLVRWLHDSNYELLDCQVHSAHVERFGAGFVARAEFTTLLKQWCAGDGNALLSGE